MQGAALHAPCVFGAEIGLLFGNRIAALASRLPSDPNGSRDVPVTPKTLHMASKTIQEGIKDRSFSYQSHIKNLSKTHQRPVKNMTKQRISKHLHPMFTAETQSKDEG